MDARDGSAQPDADGRTDPLQQAAALARLNELSSRLWRAAGLEQGLKEILYATVALLDADKGHIQLLHGGVLRIVAQQGFDRAFLDYFCEVTLDDESACGRALRSGEMVVIDDVETDEPYAPMRPVARDAGCRAVLSTPLIGHDGNALGIVSVYFQSPHRPNDRELQLLTLYVRQAAGFIERCRGEHELRESERRFRLMADAAPVLIWTSGLDKLCTWFNKPWLDFTGRTMAQELGNGWTENVHPDDLDRCFRTYSDAFDARRSFSMDYRLKRHDGEYRWVLDNGIPLLNDGGEFTGYIGSCIDITRRRHAEAALRESESQLASLFDALPVGVGIMDAGGKLVVSNREMDRYLPTRMVPSMDDTIAWRWRASHPEGGVLDRADYPGARALRGERVVPGVEFLYRQSDGTEMWTQVAAVPLRAADGAITGHVLTISDIDTAKRAGEALRQRVREQEARAFAKSLMYEIAQAVNESTTWDDAMHRVLRRLCLSGQWQVGHVYLPRQGRPDTIEPVVSCCLDERFQPFHDLSMQHTYERGEQLPGRVYAENTVVWAVRDALAAALPFRAAAAAAAGLRTAVAVPVAIRGDVVAVLELFSAQAHVADDDVTALLHGVGDQIGRVLEREQATARMADVVWREQQELLHTLHDSLGQTLTGLGMLSAGLRRRLAVTDPETVATAAEIASQSQQALMQVRLLSKSLFPVEVEAESLVAALRDLALATERLHKIQVRLHGDAPPDLHDGKVATELYRIAQEAVTNSVKHARATTITIIIGGVTGLIRLQIADDGIGVPYPEPTDGAGLRIMRYRAASIGAVLAIERPTSGGTLVTCTVREAPGSGRNRL